MMNVSALSVPQLDAQVVARARSESDTMPGYKAMWMGVCLEYIEFTMFFVVYFVARWFYPHDFQAGAARLWTMGGVLITLVMVTGGYMLTRGLASMRLGQRKKALAWFVVAMLVGAMYPVLKWHEWQWNHAHGVDAAAGIFVVVYYYVTIAHSIHACWGLMAMGWGAACLASGGYSTEDFRGLESVATYWHATDLAWLMLFALFYAFA
ncbi:MAG: cytochrome c oxidase subunit 3 [Aquabacterium sp.]|nr:cytochrome c oxidase subunit 3 [Aquabacterium sp.]